jgi:LA2681-like HEPN
MDLGAALSRWLLRPPGPIAMLATMGLPREAERRFAEANQAIAAWEDQCATTSVWTAWQRGAAEQRSARRTFDELAADLDAPIDLRAMAAVNAGNALDALGRSLEALERYDVALQLMPDSGMALGNRGMTLARLVARLHQEHDELARLARADLVAAIDPRHDMDTAARATFEAVLGRIPAAPARGEPPWRTAPYADPYAEWAFRHGLLLIATPGVRPEPDRLDPLHLGHLVVSVHRPDAASPAEFGAINAMRRDFLAARFQAWMALEAPGVGELAERSRTAYYTDTLDYARWDLATGLAAAALSAAVNLADKIGTYLVLWLELGEPSLPDHRTWAFALRKDGRPELRPALAKLMDEHAGSLRALLGLIDQAHETWDAAPVAETRAREIRNAAVHRFLTVHDEGAGQSSGPALAISSSELRDQTVASLAHARRLLLQLFVAIDEREWLKSGPNPPLYLPRYERRS